MVFIISVACLIVGCIAGFALFRYVATGKYRQIIEEASKEAEVIKEKKLLEVKEKFLNKKSELEKEVPVSYTHLIAVDFDGTIVEHRYPEIGREIPFAVETLKKLIEDRHQLILWLSLIHI